MSDINITSTEARRLREQEDAIVAKAKHFLISSLRWSIALLGAKDLLVNKQATFVPIAIALIVLFGISSRTTRSNGGKTFINVTFLILGCLVVGVTIDSIVPNSYVKWVICGLFLVMVATNPSNEQIYQEMKRILKSLCGEISLILKKMFIQSQRIIKKLLKINVADREESSMNDNSVTRPVGSDGGGVREDIV